MTPAVTPQVQTPQPPPQTLAQTVRAKYPGAYDDLDDHVLENKILAKYPQYADLPRTPPRPIQEAEPPQRTGFWGSLGGDIKNLFTGALNPSSAAGVPSPYPGVTPEVGQANWKNAMAQAQSEKAAGYSKPYMAAAGIAQGLGVNVPGMEQSAAEGDKAGVMGHAVAGAAPMIAGEALGRGLPFLKNALPSKERAGANFQSVMGATKDVPIDTTAPGNTALQIQKMAESGGSMPKVVRDFIKRGTDPSKGPITYEEARQFQQNASRLSADESQRLTPNMKRMVGQFAADLNSATSGAASQTGMLPQYQGAMKEYRRAMSMQDFQNMLKTSAVNTAKYAVPTAVGGAAAGYAAKKILGQK